MVNGCSDGVRFLENRICLRFVALNNMSHFCSHCSSMVKSSWRASMFAELLYRMVSTCTLIAPTLLSLNKDCPFPNFYCPFCQPHSNTLLKGMGMTGAGKASMFLCKHSASWSFNFFWLGYRRMLAKRYARYTSPSGPCLKNGRTGKTPWAAESDKHDYHGHAWREARKDTTCMPTMITFFSWRHPVSYLSHSKRHMAD